MRKLILNITMIIMLILPVKGQEQNGSANPIIIKMGNVFGDTEQGRMPTHTPRIQELIAKKIDQHTNGQIKWEILRGKNNKINIFRSPDMVAENDQIQATNVPASFFPRIPEMEIQSIPFLFENVEHSRRFLTSEPAHWLSQKIEETYDVKVLGHFYNAAFVSINGTKPIREPEDFSGKIINGFGKIWLPMWTDIKPKEIRYIGFSEAVTGKLVEPDSDFEINIGMIQNNNIQGLHKRFKYTTLAPNFYNIFYTMMINNNVWQGLTDFQRSGIMKAVTEGQQASIAYQIDTTLWAFQLNQSEGVEMHIQTSAERARWKKEFYSKMVEAVAEKSNEPEKTREMIKKIEALVDDLRWQ